MDKPNPFRPVRTEPCGSWASRTWHLAHGQSCVRCGTDRAIPDSPTSQRSAA